MRSAASRATRSFSDLDLACQALEGVVGHLLGLRLGDGLGCKAALLGALGALGLAGRALLLDGLATGTLGFGLLALGLGALLGELLGLLGRKLACALLDLRGQVLANLLHIGRQPACWHGFSR